MKSRFIFIISILCIGGLIGLWLAREKPPPEVIKIYKAIPYNPKPISVLQEEEVETSTDATVPETDYSDDTQTSAPLLADPELTPEEEAAFWDWLASWEETVETEEVAHQPETEEITEPEGTSTELTHWQEIQIIDDIFPLKEIIAAYGGNPSGNGVQCPLCSHPDDFYITREGTSWWCHTCSDGAHDTFEFVSRAEGITREEAHELLAEQAGLRE